MSKADQVRARIAEAKINSEDHAVVVAWAMETLGMSKGLANTYVKENWDKGVKTQKVSDKEPKEKKEPKALKEKRVAVPKNMTEVVAILKNRGVEVLSFDGGSAVTKDGSYSMYGKDIYFRTVVNEEKVVEIIKASDFIKDEKVVKVNLHIQDGEKVEAASE